MPECRSSILEAGGGGMVDLRVSFRCKPLLVLSSFGGWSNADGVCLMCAHASGLMYTLLSPRDM